MSKELKRPKESDYLIKDMYGVIQSMDIDWADYTHDLNFHIDQLESKLKASDQHRRNDLINCIKELHGDKEINANHLNWLDNEYLLNH